jgi:hypothetical protein
MRTPEVERKWQSIIDAANTLRLTDIFAALESHRIDAILLKGWSIARFYEPGHFRPSTDIDVLIAPSHDSNSIENLLLELSYKTLIDVHFGPRTLDLFSFDDLFALSRNIDLNGTLIRVLADEDNLRITSVHWLTDGGVNKEKLWDIYYMVKNRKEDFDWVRCLESNGSVRKTWVLAAIATARDNLDLDVSGLPEEVRQFDLPSRFQETLEKEWRLGLYPRHRLSTVLARPPLLLEQLRRKIPPNRIAATIDTETAIENSSRIPAQLKSLTKKASSFARGLAGRITYSIRGKRQ